MRRLDFHISAQLVGQVDIGKIHPSAEALSAQPRILAGPFPALLQEGLIVPVKPEVDVVQAVAEGCAENIANMRAALSADDLEEYGRLAHSIKGQMATIGHASFSNS